MIRIFNNARQRLAAEGKLTRYLGYAVGEIVLIVADIEEFDWDVVARPYDATALLNDRGFLNTLKVEQDNHEGTAEKLETMIGINNRLQSLIGPGSH